MSALDDTFLFFQAHPTGYTIDATLTHTEQVPTLPAFILTVSAAPVTYVPGPPPTIGFNVMYFCKTPPPKPGGSIWVKLTQNPGPPVFYSMHVGFLIPFNCPHVTVDAMSGVTYGSQGAQFVTLVLKPGLQG
jgi:hypothetical protein